MKKGISAVSNSGPVIHLRESDAVKAFNIFNKVFYPWAVYEELSKKKQTAAVLKHKLFQEKTLNAEGKRKTEFIYLKYGIGLAEAEAMALALQEKIKLFLTDDLEARTVAKEFNLKPVGSIGILLRAFRENVLVKEELMLVLKKLLEESSLFVTQKIIKEVIKEIEIFETKYKKN